MAIPSGIIKYCGTWSSGTYQYADMVVSPIDLGAYVLVISTITGGSDPSVPSADWVLVPSGGGGGGGTITAVIAGTNLQGGGSSGAVTLDVTDNINATNAYLTNEVGASFFTNYGSNPLALLPNTDIPISISTAGAKGGITLNCPDAVLSLNDDGLATAVKINANGSFGNITDYLSGDGVGGCIWRELPVKYYASFSSDLTQPLTDVNVPQIVTHNTEEINSGGFAIVAGSIEVENAGTYEIGTSIQFKRTSGAAVTTINFWFRINDLDVPRSCSQTSMTGNNAEFLATVSILPNVKSNDIIKIMMGGADTSVECLAVPEAAANPPTTLGKPAIPSIITNIKLIS